MNLPKRHQKKSSTSPPQQVDSTPHHKNSRIIRIRARQLLPIWPHQVPQDWPRLRVVLPFRRRGITLRGDNAGLVLRGDELGGEVGLGDERLALRLALGELSLSVRRRLRGADTIPPKVLLPPTRARAHLPLPGVTRNRNRNQRGHALRLVLLRSGDRCGERGRYGAGRRRRHRRGELPRRQRGLELTAMGGGVSVLYRVY
ncbi:hypothetical protein B0H19DRAFT_108009 [Mycena capillaripes]|nr:hypothetical protein B0H19DRAFT_108009 [Mycena capillaripes]